MAHHVNKGVCPGIGAAFKMASISLSVKGSVGFGLTSGVVISSATFFPQVNLIQQPEVKLIMLRTWFGTECRQSACVSANEKNS